MIAVGPAYARAFPGNPSIMHPRGVPRTIRSRVALLSEVMVGRTTKLTLTRPRRTEAYGSY